MSFIEGRWCLVARISSSNCPRILLDACAGGSVIIELLFDGRGFDDCGSGITWPGIIQ